MEPKDMEAFGDQPMLLRCIDLETTGMPSAEDKHAIVEVGWSDVTITVMDPTTGLVMADVSPHHAAVTNPNRPIPPEAMAVHHITNVEAGAGIPATTALRMLMEGPPSAFVAHNSAFEQQFFAGGEVPWICTMKVSLRVLPDAPSHSLQVLRYLLDLDVDPVAAQPPHRAGPDAYVCAALVAHFIEQFGTTVEQMIAWTKLPAYLTRFNFGKHSGKRYTEVPIDYLEWIVDKSDLDADVKYTARTEIKRRRMP